MNSDDRLMTFDEAADWKFCERCGAELKVESKYGYAYDTGEKYEDSRMKVCPRRSGDDPHHTRIELVGDLEVVPA